jgi:aminomethyltransferase
MTTHDATKPRETPLRGVHEQLGATMTEFAGWLMPLRYRSETAEHQAVRSAAGLFDLSHMGEISVSGPGAAAALDYALVGHLSAVPPGRARYTMICAADGGILDDLIVYRLADEEFLVVANAANTDVVYEALLQRAAGHDARITDQTASYALIAIQGPAAAGILGPLTDIQLDGVKYYASHRGTVAGRPILLARTGYTGEDGFELFTSPEDAERIWRALSDAGSSAGLSDAGSSAGLSDAGSEADLSDAGSEADLSDAGSAADLSDAGSAADLSDAGSAAGSADAGPAAGAAGATSGPGLVPAGLAARDTLRLEAGMPLYGNELGPDTTPFDAGLGRVVKLDKPGDFVGRAALTAASQAPARRVLVGLRSATRRVPRHGYTVLWDGEGHGTVTSGAPSPTLGVPIAMAYVDPDVARLAAADTADDQAGAAGTADDRLAVDIRGRAEPARLTTLPFYHRPR